jgi:6-pyruvoyltetrahydropterin/6-carboxytetrahydropterin synthase
VAWVDVAGSELQTSGSETGMVMDLGAISDRVKPMVEQYLDHYCLNDTLPLESPTSEALAQWIYEHLNRHCRLPVSAVTIEETCTSACTYRV